MNNRLISRKKDILKVSFYGSGFKFSKENLWRIGMLFMMFIQAGGPAGGQPFEKVAKHVLGE